MEVKDVHRPVIASCVPGDPLHDVATTMQEGDAGFVAVVNDGRLHGVISERDLVGAMARDVDPHTTTAADIATTDVVVGMVSMRDVFALETLLAGLTQGGSDA